jgi:hypothetical protein
MSPRLRRVIAAALAALPGLGACRQAERGAAPATLHGEAAPVSGAADVLRAEVHEVLCARNIAPGESLRVRVIGVIGPNGAYSLQELHVTQQAGRVVVDPRVRRAEGGMYIQMLIPLDSTLALALAPGKHVLEVLGTSPAFTAEVQVTSGADRAAPQTSSEPAAAGGGADVQVWLQGSSADGWVEAIEWRVEGSGGPWQRAEEVERRGAGLRCVVRVPGAPATRIEARAIDGQGVADPSPATLQLP